jgi:hypothetical protein
VQSARAYFVFTALLAAANPARGAIVDIDFQGPLQTMSGTVDLSGKATAQGGGVAYNAVAGKNQEFQLTPPFDHTFGLDGGPAAIATNPYSVAPSTTTFDVVGGQITAINNLALEFINTPLPFFTEPFTLTTDSSVSLLKAFTVSFTNSIGEFQFQQDGAATLVPTGVGSGTFVVPGSVFVALTGLYATIADVIVVPLGAGSGTLPLVLEGTYQITGPANNATISLDGHGLYGANLLPDTGQFNYAASSPLALTVSADVYIPNAISLDFAFHLEQHGLVVPEPQSVVLLAIGIVALLCGWRRSSKLSRR